MIRICVRTYNGAQSAAAQALFFKMTGQTLLHNARGAPVTADGFVSIAHTKTLVACAVGDVSLGIDLELRSGRTDRVWQWALTEGERQDPYQSWCRKEAYVKYLGTGFTTAPRKIDTETLPVVFWDMVREGNQLSLCTAREESVEISWNPEESF